MFYVYEWYNVNTEEIFYVGKGCGNRYKQVSKRNQLFKTYYENNECAVRIIRYFDLEQDAFDYEKQRIGELKSINQCSCNLDEGGSGGVNFVWTPEMDKMAGNIKSVSKTLNGKVESPLADELLK